MGSSVLPNNLPSIVLLFVHLDLYLSIQGLSGDEGIRTPGLRLAKAALSQLSYIPRLSFGPGGPFRDRT